MEAVRRRNCCSASAMIVDSFLRLFHNDGEFYLLHKQKKSVFRQFSPELHMLTFSSLDEMGHEISWFRYKVEC